MRKACLVVLFAVLAAGRAWCQEKPAAAAQPGPEQQALAGLVGTWKTEGDWLETPLGPGGKWWGTIESKWFQGECVVTRKLDEKNSLGEESQSLDIIAFDRVKGKFSWFAVDSQGGHSLMPVEVADGALIFRYNLVEKGKEFVIRITLNGLGGETLTCIQEYSPDGTNWKPLAKSTDTRVQPK